MSRYLSVFEMLNPMHRIWSDGRWNKLTLAHGCYWKKCSFCDVTLDYIGRYDPAPADLIVDRMAAVFAQTGQSGFHFVDEAAPPALLRALAERLLARVRQLFAAGCIQSAYWHRFSATAHSPFGKDPAAYGIELDDGRPAQGRLFARNDLAFRDLTGADHDMLGEGLRKALYNYMHG